MLENREQKRSRRGYYWTVAGTLIGAASILIGFILWKYPASGSPSPIANTVAPTVSQVVNALPPPAPASATTTEPAPAPPLAKAVRHHNAARAAPVAVAERQLPPKSGNIHVKTTNGAFTTQPGTVMKTGDSPGGSGDLTFDTGQAPINLGPGTYGTGDVK
jgi:hypothetical protein